MWSSIVAMCAPVLQRKLQYLWDGGVGRVLLIGIDAPKYLEHILGQRFMLIGDRELVTEFPTQTGYKSSKAIRIIHTATTTIKLITPSNCSVSLLPDTFSSIELQIYNKNNRTIQVNATTSSTDIQIANPSQTSQDDGTIIFNACLSPTLRDSIHRLRNMTKGAPLWHKNIGTITVSILHHLLLLFLLFFLLLLFLLTLYIYPVPKFLRRR